MVRRMVKNLKRRQKAVEGSRDVPVAQGSVVYIWVWYGDVSIPCLVW